MIRSSQHSLKFVNQSKQELLNIFIYDYRNMVKKYVNIIWNKYKKGKVPSLLENEVCQSIVTNRINDSRIRQCAAKQACSMVKAVLDKPCKRLYKLKQLQREGKNTKYLQRKISLSQYKKPTTDNVNVELDSRFVNIQATYNHFDLFVEIKQIGNKEIIRIPIQYTKVSQKWLQQGKLKNSIRLNEKYLTLYFEVEEPIKTGSKIIGADQGQLTCLTLSDGQVTQKNKDGYDLNAIQEILSRRKKGSQGFRKAQTHRKNYIHWSLNQLNFNDIKEVKLEKIKDIRKGKRSNRKMSHWTYTLIKDKLISLSENKGFVIIEQDNKFRSQRCSSCGFVHKSNRKGKTFQCKNCQFITDSDLNAASNHEITLIDLDQSLWYKHLNRSTGFYWFEDKVVCN
jgi:transposase